ncbi:hypothetical protein M408DRAFT_316608 [Serendipita vermifera MAFF 305830]|uniref:MYND-type domain-containing protein n=1 Tax=Serendipita vermifera MAFF 305830 TaxID=933852 RepID=A0A0C2X777_SERVB|nr:hypothetical protein M408DRAFT_316608 [Serendipita vermifera MAFF 305830]
MATPSSVTSLVEVQKITQYLSSHNHVTELDGEIMKRINPSTWHYFCEAGFSDFLIDRCKYPSWFNDLQLSGTALCTSFLIHKSGGSQDLNFVSRIRETIVQKYFKPLLSSSPLFGLSDPYVSIFGLMSLGNLILVMQNSLKVVPNDSFSRAFFPDAIKISTLIWCLASTAETKLLGKTVLSSIVLDGFKNATIDLLEDTLTTIMEHVPVEKIADNCKEVLLEGIESRLSNPCSMLQSLIVVFIISFSGQTPPTKGLFDALLKQNVHHFVLLAARQLMEDEEGVCKCVESHGLLSVLSYVLSVDTNHHNGFQNQWFKIFETMTHSVGCDDIDCKCWGRTNLFEDAIRTALEQDRLWLKTSGKLRARSKDNSSRVSPQKRKEIEELWLKLGMVMGLQEDEPGAGCQWHKCERHGRDDEETEWMLRKCSKCLARYCSVDCQKKDWKEGHKKSCGLT